jgi:hypothetical protein
VGESWSFCVGSTTHGDLNLLVAVVVVLGRPCAEVGSGGGGGLYVRTNFSWKAMVKLDSTNR